MLPERCKTFPTRMDVKEAVDVVKLNANKQRHIKANEEMMKNKARLYVKKPIPIFAMPIDQTFWVETLEGNHQGKEGDYLIKGIKGELYICDKEIFDKVLRESFIENGITSFKLEYDLKENNAEEFIQNKIKQ